MPTIEDAIALALHVHRGQVDRAGAPYILHPLRMMSRFYSETERLVAVLHDVVEDSDLTLDDLRKLGYAEQVVYAVDCLTKREGEPYADLIARAKSNPIARRVKLADLEDNMDVRRYPQLGEKELERLQKYRTAWAMLMQE
jgi:(p)ppGpp synthase/HD superfamily hydrolase